MSTDNQVQNMNEAEYGSQYKQHLLEQYKLYVEMADRISQRRVNSNTFFITIESLILTSYGVIKSLSLVNCVLILIAGIATSLVWYSVVKNYKQL